MISPKIRGGCSLMPTSFAGSPMPRTSASHSARHLTRNDRKMKRCTTEISVNAAYPRGSRFGEATRKAPTLNKWRSSGAARPPQPASTLPKEHAIGAQGEQPPRLTKMLAKRDSIAKIAENPIQARNEKTVRNDSLSVWQDFLKVREKWLPATPYVGILVFARAMSTTGNSPRDRFPHSID